MSSNVHALELGRASKRVDIGRPAEVVAEIPSSEDVIGPTFSMEMNALGPVITVAMPRAPVETNLPLLKRSMKLPAPVVERLIASTPAPTRGSVLTQVIAAAWASTIGFGDAG